jgi:hypothetical protein
MHRVNHLHLSLVALLPLVVLGNGSSIAQQRRALEIDSVRLGLPGGPKGERRVRLGAWSPVYVTLKAGKENVGAGDYELVTEASDGDSQAQYFTSVPALSGKEERTVQTYYRPGDREGSVRVTLRTAGGGSVQTVNAEPQFNEKVNPNEVLYLAIGTIPGGLQAALAPRGRGKEEPGEEVPEQVEQSIARIDVASQMPTHWFGYQSADVIVLSTANTKFLDSLLEPSAALGALGEWVQRGGRLVISVGRNFQRVGEPRRGLLARLGIRDFTLNKLEPVDDLPGLQTWTGQQQELPGLAGVEVVRVSLREGAVRLASEKAEGKGWPVVALSPFGMGRVVLVAFDFDTPAFSGWKGKTAFWERVERELSPINPRREIEGRGGPGDERAELAATLQRGLESFEEVPVISFGWVAFFILIYILIVGPLDYLFLKKVVKRLELTWVTFPLVVLIVSVAAYITAYKLKGNHLRVNKIDVVDINLRDGQVQGTTWFSIFSPRVQSYVIGIEPAPDWSGGAKAGQDTGFKTVVTTLNAPDNSVGGVDRPGSQPLFRRPYQYARDASGLRGVPVPVWASRSFTASWGARIEPGQVIEVSKDFGLSKDGTRLGGQIHNHLAVELSEVSLFYDGRWYPLANLPARASYRLEGIPVGALPNIGEWLQDSFRHIESPKAKERRATEGKKKAPEKEEREERRYPDILMKGLLFHGHRDNPMAVLGNSGLRSLDQGWRLRPFKEREKDLYLDEAIVIGRAVQTPAAAEEVSQDGVSPTRLWLGRLPGEGEREPLKGFLGQDTYVRIYIPVPRKTD